MILICIYTNRPREDSVISLLNTCFHLIFDVLHAATGNRYADGIHFKKVNLGPIAFFSSYKVTKSSRKHLENITNAQIVSLKYKLMTSAKDADGLTIGFDRDRDRRHRE